MMHQPFFEDQDMCSHPHSAKEFAEGFSAGLIVVCTRCGRYDFCRPYKHPEPETQQTDETTTDEDEEECDCATPVIGAIAWTGVFWLVVGLVILSFVVLL